MVAALPSGAKDLNPAACFTVSTQQQTNMLDTPAAAAELANLIADECAKRSLMPQNSETAIALDCSMFMQHSMHSEFSDINKVAQTIRFDAEESLATDVSDLAIAFKIGSVRRTGADVIVFTSQKKLLFELLGALQTRNIDPISIEPDVNCLSRFILRSSNKQASEPSNRVFAVLSETKGYLISPDTSAQRKISIMRTFLIGPSQDRTALIKREFALTNAIVDEPVKTMEIFDSSGTVNIQHLAELLSIKTENLDLTGPVFEPAILTDCPDKVAFAIAAGAAEAFLDKQALVDFRADFNPYQGKKLRLQKTIKFLSISFVLLMVALGIYFQKAYFDANKPRQMKRSEFEQNFLAVMPGTSKTPASMKAAVKELSVELTRLKSSRQPGRIDGGQQTTVPDKLTMLLQAFNKCAKPTNLEIDSISVTGRTIRVIGSTSSYQNTMQLRQAIQQAGLEIPNEELSQKGNRHHFILNINVKGQQT